MKVEIIIINFIANYKNKTITHRINLRKKNNQKKQRYFHDECSS